MLDQTFYISAPEACNYLPGREARNVFAPPSGGMTNTLYSSLIDLGFRRSGSFVYRPHCRACTACVPTRIPVEDFMPSRSQRRNLSSNRELSVRMRKPVYREEHYALYSRYQSERHPGGGMDEPTPQTYQGFLTSDWSQTMFVDFTVNDRVVAVAVTDILDQGLSAVYTFFDPALHARGLGTHAILWQIEEARRRELRYLYLGYWIAESPKMAYKSRFRGIEGLMADHWQPLSPPPGSAMDSPD